MSDARFPTDLRAFSTDLARTALATPGWVFAATIAVVIAMGVVTGVIARAYHDTRERVSANEFREGEADAGLGRHDEALEHYRSALALDRDNPAYRRAVALTLLSLRRPAEAERHLGELLTHDPVDGEATLLLARLAASRGAFADTEALYQRAIYGRWETDPAARRLAARFELIEWLQQVGARARARAELLRLQAELPDVPFLQEELASRFFELGEPAQAAVILRREADRRPNDASIAADLARAELDARRFVEARDAARHALALDPADRATRDRLTQATDVLSLDPTRPGVSATERFRRSQRLLRRVRDDVEGCVGDIGAAAASAKPAQGAPPSAAAPGAPDASSPDAGLTAALATAERLLDDERAIGPPPAAVKKPAAETPKQTAGPGAASVSREQTPAAGASPGAAATAPASASASASVAAPATPSVDARADARLAVAQTLWSTRIARCGPSDGALAWIFDRLSR